MSRCLVVAAHRVVMVTFTLTCDSLSLFSHLPHTHLLGMGLIMPFVSDIFIENYAFNFHNLIIESHSV